MNITIIRLKMILVILISIVTTTFTISNLKSEYWNDTFPTPDGTCGTAYDNDMNDYNSTTDYASVHKEKVFGGTKVETFGQVSSRYYRHENVDSTVSAGIWSIDAWYHNDEDRNGKDIAFVGDTYGTISGSRTFWLKKPRDVKGKSDAFIVNHPDESSEASACVAAAWVEWPSEEQPPSENEDDSENLGITPADPDQDPPIPGDRFEFIVVCDSPFYWIDVWVKTPWDTNEKGTKLGSGVFGDGNATEEQFSYTFPSGLMNTGLFQITATIYRYSDMSDYTETYSVFVSVP
ncbi:hypothetical protein F4X73_04520 [Candidatus Poribacteria bacterium]|nr:hypothetical protein [Candidatus Poribacteria bacterium]